MDPASHLYLYRRHWASILLISLLGFAATFGFLYLRNPATYESTLFLNIGTVQRGDASTSYDNVQAADLFTETVQGWFKNPKLLEQIEEGAQSSVNISARKQEKQNLIVTFGAPNEKKAHEIAQITVQQLQSEIEAYNLATNSSYTLALSSESISAQNSRIAILGAIGLVLGLALAIALAYFFEFLFGVGSFRHQIEALLDKKSDEILPSTGGKPSPLLETLMSAMPHKHTLIIGVTAPSDLEIKSSEIITFPRDAREILDKKEKVNIVVICRLGKAKLQDIERLKSFLPQNYLLVTAFS